MYLAMDKVGKYSNIQIGTCIDIHRFIYTETQTFFKQVGINNNRFILVSSKCFLWVWLEMTGWRGQTNAHGKQTNAAKTNIITPLSVPFIQGKSVSDRSQKITSYWT